MVTPPVGTVLPSHNPACFGCGDTADGLGLRFRVTAPSTVGAEVTLDERHQGAPGIAHGGMVALLFDEALGYAQAFVPGRAVTANLTTDFRLPVPIGEPLRLVARLDRQDGRKLRTSGEILLADDRVAATATGLFVVVPAAHFARFAPVRAQQG